MTMKFNNISENLVVSRSRVGSINAMLSSENVGIHMERLHRGSFFINVDDETFHFIVRFRKGIPSIELWHFEDEKVSGNRLIQKMEWAWADARVFARNCIYDIKKHLNISIAPRKYKISPKTDEEDLNVQFGISNEIEVSQDYDDYRRNQITEIISVDEVSLVFQQLDGMEWFISVGDDDFTLKLKFRYGLPRIELTVNENTYC